MRRRHRNVQLSQTPTNGAKPSRENLRRRIDTHNKGNAEDSTLRRSLGCLLAGQLGIELRRYGSGDRRHFGVGEQFLSGWMHDNALVSWIVHPQPWLLEPDLIKVLDLPLNSDGNRGNPFYNRLKAAREDASRRAGDLPILPNPGTGGARIAYRDRPTH